MLADRRAEVFREEQRRSWLSWCASSRSIHRDIRMRHVARTSPVVARLLIAGAHGPVCFTRRVRFAGSCERAHRGIGKLRAARCCKTKTQTFESIDIGIRVTIFHTRASYVQ